jgi:hypothetical protein
MTQINSDVQHHPVVVAHRERWTVDLQLRIADAITTFAGSMPFVYIHAVVFAVWMIFLESDPWPKLTLIVSLEAIFLSTFVMIGQNRQAAFQQAKADHDFVEQELELKINTELTRWCPARTTRRPTRSCSTAPATAKSTTAPAVLPRLDPGGHRRARLPATSEHPGVSRSGLSVTHHRHCHPLPRRCRSVPGLCARSVHLADSLCGSDAARAGLSCARPWRELSR